MTNAGFRLAVAGAALYLTAGATAEAAKGVQKVLSANGQRATSGVVMSFTHTNASGLLHVRSARYHKKRGGMNAGNFAGGNQQQFGHAFNVTAATRVTHRNGNPVSVAALHRGERVRVQAMGQQALHVQILSQNRMRGSFARHRLRTYRPNLIRQANRVQQLNRVQQANTMQKSNSAQKAQAMPKANVAQKAHATHQPNMQKSVQHQTHRRR
jgi:hypothetical protein